MWQILREAAPLRNAANYAVLAQPEVLVRIDYRWTFTIKST
jgi:hypothetical protein